MQLSFDSILVIDPYFVLLILNKHGADDKMFQN